MQIDVLYRPAHSLAKIRLGPNESIVAESGAMVGMSSNLRMETAAGGLKAGLKRLFGGESFFRNTFRADAAGGELLLAHALCGDMVALDLPPAGLFLQGSAFIAASEGVAIDTKVGGFKSFFSGAGLFVLKASGQGKLLAGAFGGLQELTCDGSLVIDTGHLVAWDTGLQYEVGRSASGLVASFLSGEGLVCHFKGTGRIWIQSRNPQEYGSLVGGMLPPRKE